jgi:hypothetical protein
MSHRFGAACALLCLATCTPATTRPPPRTPPPPPPPPASEQPRAIASATPKPKLPTAIARGTPAEVEQAWLGLPASKDDCGQFDYFPDGGMRNFHCHVRATLGYKRIQELAGVAAFRKGPHSREALGLSSSDSFGYYNPAFVRWLGDHLIPGPRLRAQTQPIYDKVVRPLARTFYAAHRKLHSDAKYLAKEKARYLGLIKRGHVPPGDYERYFFFMNPRFLHNPDGGFSYFHRRGFDGGVNGNVVKTCVAFWIRRSIDGTDGEFLAGLERLLSAYDARFLERARKGASPDWGKLVGM